MFKTVFTVFGFSEELEKELSSLDVNCDGYISWEELEGYLIKKKRASYPRSTST